MSTWSRLLDRLFGVPKLRSVPAAGAVILMVIRHGEKPPTGGAQGWTAPSGGKADSHSLTMGGWARAQGLVDLFTNWAGTGKARPDLWTPTHLYAADGPSAGERMRQTISLLSTKLAKAIVLAYDKGKYKNLAKALLALQSGARALVSWEHSEIPKIAKAIGAKGYPSSWADDRFDVIWVFTSDGKGGWAFTERPEMVLTTDKPSGIKGNPLTYPVTPPVTPPKPPEPPVTPPPVNPPKPPPVVPPITPSTKRPGEVLDFSRWKLDYAPNDGSAMKTLQSAALKTSPNIPPYFHTVYGVDFLPDVVFETWAGSDTTSDATEYSRAELREMVKNSLKLASWSAEHGRHELSLSGYPYRVPAGDGEGVVIAQIHNKDDDQLEVLLRPDATVICRINGTSKGQPSAPAPLTKRYLLSIVANEGTTAIVWNNKILTQTTAIKGTGSYFKAGCYLNEHTDHAAIGISGLNVVHTPEIS